MRYFVVADPHGFTNILKKTLIENEFDINNSEHKVIICGDTMDRGEEAVEMFKFLKQLGDSLIYIRGNHEDLFIDCLREMTYYGIPRQHHIHNGTRDTILQLGFDQAEEFQNFFNQNSLDYYETKNYIFVHGWIPTKLSIGDSEKCKDLPSDYWPSENVYDPDWREATFSDWESARWFNGMHMWHKGIVEPNKTIVCGHWHCGYGNKHYHNESGNDIDLSNHPFIDKGIIALDACTAATHKINCIVIDDDEEI